MKTMTLGVVWPLLACGITLGGVVAGCSSSDMQPMVGTGGLSGSGGKSGTGGSKVGGSSSSGGGDPSGGRASLGGEGGGVGGSGAEFDPQFPPTEADEVEQWLAAGFYKTWVCEDQPSAKTEGAAAIHVHGPTSRICSNVLLAASVAPGKTGELPQGVAAVKEVYDKDNHLTGTFVTAKTKATSDVGDNWYWYAPGADGFGLSDCTGCHSAAGSDADHPGAGDYVYFQVKDDQELPPVGNAEALATWLDTRAYDEWSCEQSPNLKDDGAAAIHVHGITRVCTNSLLASSTKAGGVFPAGVASVKEIFEDNSAEIKALAVSVKTGSASQGGDGWYWYEGASTEGFGISACVGCHSAAGSDADHPGAGDFVYFSNAK